MGRKALARCCNRAVPTPAPRLAGVEYFDHLRAFRSKDSYVKRTLLTDNPAKANLADTIRKVALVA